MARRLPQGEPAATREEARAVTATRSGPSETGYGPARHRASTTPVHRPSGRSRRTHARSHSKFWAGLVGIVVGVALVVVTWRLLDVEPAGDPDTSPAPVGSSVSTTTVDVGDDGDVHVAVDLHLASPVARLTLRVPEAAWAAGEFEPVVDEISLDIAGRHLDLDDPLGPGERRSVALLSRITEVRLEYDATGTFAASTPSSPGRGLVLLTPLTVVEGVAMSQVEVADDRVLNLGCIGTGELSACATRDGETWVATPVADADQVIAQVDLDPH